VFAWPRDKLLSVEESYTAKALRKYINVRTPNKNPK
jgi:hypothetical protein